MIIGKSILLAPYLMAVLIEEGSDIPTDEWYEKAELARKKKTGQTITTEKGVPHLQNTNMKRGAEIGAEK